MLYNGNSGIRINCLDAIFLKQTRPLALRDKMRGKMRHVTWLGIKYVDVRNSTYYVVYHDEGSCYGVRLIDVLMFNIWNKDFVMMKL